MDKKTLIVHELKVLHKSWAKRLAWTCVKSSNIF